MYDIGIIGGGPGGYVAAVKAAQLGLKAVLFEHSKLGGVCLNKGCIPTKTLLKSAEVLHIIKTSSIFGVETSSCVLDMPSVLKRKDKLVDKLVGNITSLLNANGVQVVDSKATIVSKNEIQAGSNIYSVKNIIVATGSKPFIPSIEGIKSPNVMTSDDILSMKDVPKSIAIIGGGVIGVEFAFLLSQFGCKVTIIEWTDSLIPMADYEISSALNKKLTAMGIDVICGGKVTEINNDGLKYEKDNKSCDIITEKILISVGRSPALDHLSLSRIGVSYDSKGISTDNSLCTNILGIYAIGDANGKSMLAHTASAEGIVAVKNIAGHNASVNYNRIPQCIYTLPEIAWVGLTEKEAGKLFDDIGVFSFPMSANGKSLVEGDSSGFIKLISNKKSGEILGAHMFCARATDLISEVVLAMNAEACVEDIAGSIHGHPTISEALMETAEGILGSAIHWI